MTNTTLYGATILGENDLQILKQLVCLISCYYLAPRAFLVYGLTE